MSDTSLSPRLRHLLIQEDRRTGRLVMPDQLGTRDLPATSPPMSPLTHRHESSLSPPLILHTPPMTSGLHLPPLQSSPDHRPKTSISSLLNTFNSMSTSLSPPSPPISPFSHPNTYRSSFAAPPRTAPIPHNQKLFLTQQQKPPSRPDFLRRHSSHPYEIPHSSQPMPPPPSEHMQPYPSTSRTPISRTTKACNACRSRKVRCDAGGSVTGEVRTCSRCRESGVVCVYTGMQRKRGPCPGTAKPTITIRSRRSSQSQRPSISTSTPNDEDYPVTPSSRSSYGFPPPTPNMSGWSSNQPRPLQPGQPTRAHPSQPHAPPPHLPPPSRGNPTQTSILSWPQMQPATEEGHRMFDKEYSVRGGQSEPMVLDEDYRGDGFAGGRTLPPLRVAIGRRESYYEP